MRAWGRERWFWVSALFQHPNTCSSQLAALSTWPRPTMEPWHSRQMREARPPATQEGKRPALVETASADGSRSKPGASWTWRWGGWDRGCVCTEASSPALASLASGSATLARLHESAQHGWLARWKADEALP